MADMIAASALIDDLWFTVGTYNCLRRGGVETVADLCSLTEAEVFALIPLVQSPNKRMDEIKVVLKKYGRFLATPPPFKPSVAPQIL